MTYELNWTDQTFGSFISQVGNSVGFWELALFCEFVMIVIIGGQWNKKNTGYTNIVEWIPYAGVVTTFSATLLLLGGFISMLTLLTSITITICAFLFNLIAHTLFKDSMV